MANIRVDDELKNNADKMFDEVGMSTFTAVKIFLTKFVNTGKFPFDIE
ncbi:type II toxin-antitoxin system RelB/DinJ family antitoxin [Enterococcus faecalis]|nr:type II toxin-antitoxin system RelB/DinJ family antitoxin [Enterococcus faecalis]MDR9788682.1 type II toxin-antitoxin system RelB/DinJ family antitoxin [Enterococcus faecalis]